MEGTFFTAVAYIAVFLTFPLSLWFCFKVVVLPISLILDYYSERDWLQILHEYERALIFRLGKEMPGGDRGPGEM